MNMKTIMHRLVILLLVASAATGRIASAAAFTCKPATPDLTNAREITIPSHTLSINKVVPDTWVELGSYSATGVKVMGDNCDEPGIGMDMKRFYFSGTGVQPKFIGFAPPDGDAIFEVSSAYRNVGITIKVRKSTGGPWIKVQAGTALNYIDYSDVAQPAVDVQVTLYVKVPPGSGPGRLIIGGRYPRNIFNDSGDEINGIAVGQTDYPVQVILGDIWLDRPTCQFSVSEQNKTIDMGSIDPSAFNAPGAKSADHPFTVSTERCNEVTTGLHMEFEPDGPVTNPDLFPTSKPELGLGLISLDSRGAPVGGQSIKPNDGLDFDPATPATGAATYHFKAFLEQLGSGPVSSGGVDAKVRVMVTYD
jgi:type 1 fimbria pilin